MWAWPQKFWKCVSYSITLLKEIMHQPLVPARSRCFASSSSHYICMGWEGNMLCGGDINNLYSCQLQPSWNAQYTFPEIGPYVPVISQLAWLSRNAAQLWDAWYRFCIQLEILNLVVGPQISAHCKKMLAALNLVIAKVDHQTTKFNSLPNFLALQYIVTTDSVICIFCVRSLHDMAMHQSAWVYN